MLALLVEGVFHWGFSVRIVTESAGAQYYPYPPPSTLIGALAYGVSSVLELPECRLSNRGKRAGLVSSAAFLYSSVPWATFALSDSVSAAKRAAAVGYSDFIRAFRLLYQRGARHTWEQRDMWYGVNAHGKVYACGAGFKAIYLIDEEGLSDLGLTERELLAAAHSIVRIGARESLVSVISAEATKDLEVLAGANAKGPFETEFYFPSRLAEEVENAETIHLPKLDARLWEFRPESPVALHEHEEFYAPSSYGFVLKPGKIVVRELAEEGVLVNMKFGSGRIEKIVAPIEVVKQ